LLPSHSPHQLPALAVDPPPHGTSAPRRFLARPSEHFGIMQRQLTN
jgi:hypothetical protein